MLTYYNIFKPCLSTPIFLFLHFSLKYKKLFIICDAFHSNTANKLYYRNGHNCFLFIIGIETIIDPTESTTATTAQTTSSEAAFAPPGIRAASISVAGEAFPIFGSSEITYATIVIPPVPSRTADAELNNTENSTNKHVTQIPNNHQ